MSNHAYTPPVDRLLTYTADLEIMRGPWPHYLEELGLTRAHVPELVRMVQDPALWESDPDGSEIWAPVHAWRALGQLGVPEAIPPMLAVVQAQPDDDWVLNELPRVAAQIGPEAVPLLIDAFEVREAEEDPRSLAAEALTEVAIVHPSLRDQAVTALMSQLEHHATNGPTYNGFLIAFLIELDAKQALPLIEAAYDADEVDELICGDLNDTLVDLGKQPRPMPARDRALWELAKAQAMSELFGGASALPPASMSPGARASSPQAKEKAKAKRKAAKQARKKSRR